MSDSNTEKRLTVGQVVGVFGVKGWLKIKPYTEHEENIIQYAPWYVRTRHGLKQVEIDNYTFRPQGLVVHIKGVDDRDSAELYARALIDVDMGELPELDTGDYYWHQLIGLRVQTEKDGALIDLGEVVKMLETGANDVLVVQGQESSIDQSERLIPYVPEHYVKRVDLSEGLIVVDWDPEY